MSRRVRWAGMVGFMALLALVVASCAPAAAPAPEVIVETVEVPVEVTVVVEPTPVPEVEPPLLYAAFPTPLDEPWCLVIHSAMQEAADAGKIRYEWTDNIGYAGDMERVLREICEDEKPAAIFGDAFGNEEAVRRVAADFPEIAFVFGSGFPPVEPNFSVFDDVLYEPAYLLGLIAGGMTESNIIGVVAAYPVAEENILINAFIAAAKEVNPDAQVLVTFINNWFDPPAAKESALAQIDAGADVLFAERFGVVAAAVENDLWALGHQGDHNELAPDKVLTGTIWDMTACVEYVLSQVSAGAYTSQDLAQFSTMRKGGAYLAPYHGNDQYIPQEILDLVEQRQQGIKDGTFTIEQDASTPSGSQ